MYLELLSCLLDRLRTSRTAAVSLPSRVVDLSGSVYAETGKALMKRQAVLQTRPICQYKNEKFKI